MEPQHSIFIVDPASGEAKGVTAADLADPVTPATEPTAPKHHAVKVEAKDPAHKD
jgi:hypothetical protein